MSVITFETLIADQKERIQRKEAPKGSNLILDYINNTNDDLIKDGL